MWLLGYEGPAHINMTDGREDGRKGERKVKEDKKRSRKVKEERKEERKTLGAGSTLELGLSFD